MYIAKTTTPEEVVVGAFVTVNSGHWYTARVVEISKTGARALVEWTYGNGRTKQVWATIPGKGRGASDPVKAELAKLRSRATRLEKNIATQEARTESWALNDNYKAWLQWDRELLASLRARIATLAGEGK